jgi:phosphoglycolate phosphatase
MKNLKAIIFDLDGTLIHSAPDMHAAVNVTLNALGRDTLDLPTIISFIGNGFEKLVEQSLDATGRYDGSVRQTALDLYLKSYNQNITTLTRHLYRCCVCASGISARRGSDGYLYKQTNQACERNLCPS